jgi:hypothetical protein
VWEPGRDGDRFEKVPIARLERAVARSKSKFHRLLFASCRAVHAGTRMISNGSPLGATFLRLVGRPTGSLQFGGIGAQLLSMDFGWGMH